MTEIKKVGHIDLENKTTVNDVVLSTHYNGSKRHKFFVPWGISRKQAMELQSKLGYPPEGYDFESFDATASGTTWYCWHSCD